MLRKVFLVERAPRWQLGLDVPFPADCLQRENVRSHVGRQSDGETVHDVTREERRSALPAKGQREESGMLRNARGESVQKTGDGQQESRQDPEATPARQ